jgi:hypothetical protein
MKRLELIKKINKITKNKIILTYKEGGNHTKVFIDGKYFTVIPRHSEIKENLAQAIIKEFEKKVKRK